MDQHLINQTLSQSSTTPQIISKKNTDQRISEVPGDKIILAALSSKKIIDCTDEELDEVIVQAVAAIFLKVGRKSDDQQAMDQEVIYQGLPIELRLITPAMRVNEIPVAFNRGIYREFGEYYGINIAELVRFCKSHFDSEKRIVAVKSLMKPVEEPKAAPSMESQFYLFKNNLMNAFDKNKVGGNYESNAPTLYDFLKNLGLIIFSTKEKYDIMQDACKVIIRETQLKLSITLDDFNRKPLHRIIQNIQLPFEELDTDIKIILINKSKKLTLDAFFHEIQINELDLSELVDNKKELFLNR